MVEVLALLTNHGLLSNLGQFRDLLVGLDTCRDAVPEGRTSRQRQLRLTSSQVDELVKARQEGALIRELAERFGIHRTTVMEHLKRRKK